MRGQMRAVIGGPAYWRAGHQSGVRAALRDTLDRVVINRGGGARGGGCRQSALVRVRVRLGLGLC